MAYCKSLFVFCPYNQPLPSTHTFTAGGSHQDATYNQPPPFPCFPPRSCTPSRRASASKTSSGGAFTKGGSHQDSTPQPSSPHGAYSSFPPHTGNVGGSAYSPFPPHAGIVLSSLHGAYPSLHPHAGNGDVNHANNNGGIGHQHNPPPPSPSIYVNTMASMASAFATIRTGVLYSSQARNRVAFQKVGGGASTAMMTLVVKRSLKQLGKPERLT